MERCTLCCKMGSASLLVRHLRCGGEWLSRSASLLEASKLADLNSHAGSKPWLQLSQFVRGVEAK